MRRPAMVLLLSLLAVEAHRVLLVFPVPTTSHTNLGEGFVRHLLNAGHHVTYITPVPIKNPPQNLRQIDVSSNIPLFPANELLDLSKLMNKEIPQLVLKKMLHLTVVVSNATVFHAEVQQLMWDPTQQFDLVIADWVFTELYYGLATVFDCPFIWASSMELHSLALSLVGDDPNPAYVISFTSREVPPFNFLQRVKGLWTYLAIKYYKWLISQKEAVYFEAAFSAAAAARGRQLPSYSEAQHNASLMFGNSHVSLGSAVSLPQSYIPIAGFHIDEHVKPLPEDLQSIMDNAKNGVIFFSMGSILRSKSMPVHMKRDLLHMFSQLKQTVIWKLEESTESLPKNVHLVSFAPQQSILAHPNSVLFITHGGLLSNIETLHFGVPIIGIPVFADQFLNIDRAVQKGYAKRVDLDHDIPVKLKEAIEDILGNPRYRERVKELSFVYHNREVPPGLALTHWAEHVVRTRGAPHLRHPALTLPVHQRMFLDLLAVIVAVAVMLGLLLKCALSRVSGKKVHTKKKQC